MRENISSAVPKWPFFLGDAVLVGLAWFIYWESRLPLGRWEMAACALCVALGALLGVLPFVLDHRFLTRALEASALGTVAEKIQNLERLSAQISSATSHWEHVQLQAEKIANTGKDITDRMSAEVRDFTEFMKQINEGEKSTLRLEVEKLRRAEQDWLQVLVHLLDHAFALRSGAARSGQPRLIEQITQFHNACCDAARRVGLIQFAATAGDKFDPQRHQSPASESPPQGAVVAETLAPGYTLQGRLVRPVLVRAAAERAPESPAADAQQNQLSLEPSGSA